MQIQNRLENVVGQERAKLKLNFFLEGQAANGIMPHLFLYAEKGGGKTFVAKEVAKATADIQQEREGKRRDFIPLTAGQLKKVSDLEALMFDVANEGPCVIFVDECHGLTNQDVVDRLLVLLEPNAQNTGTFAIGAGDSEQRMTINFKDVTFIFATTEKDKVFGPLLDRLEKVELAPLSDEELVEVMFTKCYDNVQISNDAIKEIVRHLRGNGRSAMKMGENVNKFFSLSGVDSMELEHVKELFEIMEVYPYGLAGQEVRLLQYLRANRSGVQLQDIANYFNESPAAAKKLEEHLRRKHLMLIDGKRKITLEGIHYLDEIGQ